MSPHGGNQEPGQKAQNFRGTSRRVIAMLRPDRVKLLMIVALTAISVALTVAGP